MSTKRKKAEAQTKLPDKLSDLLRLAVNDAKAVAKMRDRYRLEMNVWHEPEPDGKCHVCMAGAVMANTLKADPQRMAHPSYFDPDDDPDADVSARDKLFTIDDMRTGNIYDVPIEVREKFRKIVDSTYNADTGRAHWRTYLKAADYLESQGL